MFASRRTRVAPTKSRRAAREAFAFRRTLVSGTSRERWGLDGFEIAIALGGSSRSGEWQRDLSWVERADARGLHSVWVPEMHFGLP